MLLKKAQIRGFLPVHFKRILLDMTSSLTHTQKNQCASFIIRCGASLIDFLFISFICLTLGAYLNFGEALRLTSQMFRNEPVITDAGVHVTSGIPTPVVTAFLVTFILVPWLYYALLESSQNQATLGKMVVGILVTDRAMQRITFTRATLRHFAKIISLLVFGIGFFCILYTKKRQGLHDYVARTYVCYDDQH
jgi:uncharacterized RDD family membrane protein YckC